jgi:hypothetical protein
MAESDDPEIRRCGHCSRDIWFCWSASEVDEALRSGHPVVKGLALDRDVPTDFDSQQGDIVEGIR